MGKAVPVFHGFIGQRKLVRVLRRIIAGAKKKGEACLALLLLGASGLGKTALAEAISKEYDTKLHLFYSSEKLTTVMLARAAQTWAPFDFVFIDEAHKLPAEIQDAFYRIMIERKVPKVEEQADGKPPRIVGETSVAAVTVIAATDQGGTLNSAFIKRFSLVFDLRLYTSREMIAIVRQRAAKLKMLLSPQAAKAVAASCRGVPRVAGWRLETMRHYFGQRNPDQFTSGHVECLLRSLEIDNTYRTRLDRQYMRILAQHGGAGVSLQTIALAAASDANHIRTDVEPWLLQMGWTGIAPSGRYLTEAGKTLVAEDLKEKSN